MLFTTNLWYDLICISVSLLAALIAYYKWIFTYWERKGLEGPKPSIPFGNANSLVMGKFSVGEFWKRMYLDLKHDGLRHGGVYMFLKKIYVPVDQEIIKNILLTNFQSFTGHGFYVNEKLEPLSANLFFLDGQKWKSTRTVLSPTFTNVKLKMMFQTMLQSAEGLKELLESLHNSKAPFDVKDIMARFTTDMIGSCAFGIECNSLKNPDAEFRRYGIMAAAQDFWGTVRMLCQLLIPHTLLRFLKFRNFRVEVSKFFYQAVVSTVEYREKNNVVRNDFLNLLIQLKNKGSVDDKGSDKNGSSENKTITLDALAAQCFIFFLGGFETSSTTLNFLAFEIAINPIIQDKLRNEINIVLEKHNNELTYDAVSKMTYMDKVIQETLRKYPPLPTLFRVCTRDCKIPNSDIVIEKGDTVIIPTLGIHNDPEYYPDPEKFDPERFSEESKSGRPNFSWLPFGEGPRICIGLRFGLLQTKLGLIALLKHYKISLNEKTKIPLEFDKNSFVPSNVGGIWLNIEKI